MKKNTRTPGPILKFIVPLLIIAVGVILFKMMAAHKRPTAQKITVSSGALVQVMVAVKIDRQVNIPATGIIAPKQEINVIPQVGGKLVYVAPSFEAGGYFAKGDILLKIEDIDYRLAIERAQAQVAKMEFELTAMQSKAEVAGDEWRRLHPDGSVPANPLVLYTPQLKDAKANLQSATAALKQAQVNLSRTRITAPFNCRVRSEQVAIGQYLTPGSKAAVLVGSDEAEVIVPVPLADLTWLRVPRGGQDKKGSAVVVQIDSATGSFSNGSLTAEWPGRLSRSLGEVDQVGKMIRLAVTISDPYHLHGRTANSPAGAARKPELALGMFVRVIFKGRIAAGVIAIPRQALRENDTVWLMTAANKLKIVKVEISRREHDEILVRSGLMPGDRVVLTKLVGAVDGMSLKLAVGDQIR